MMSIEIKTHKNYEYKGLKIGIWHTMNKKFIHSTWASSYLGDSKYLSDEGRKRKESFTGLYFWDCTLPDGSFFNEIFPDNILCSNCSFKLTEVEAIERAKEVIDHNLEAAGMKVFDLSIPTHIYDPDSGETMRCWCNLDEYDDWATEVHLTMSGEKEYRPQ